jgi:hypothetical protein
MAESADWVFEPLPDTSPFMQGSDIASASQTLSAEPLLFSESQLPALASGAMKRAITQAPSCIFTSIVCLLVGNFENNRFLIAALFVTYLVQGAVPHG